MYTKEEYDNLLREIAQTGGDTPAMLDLLQKLRDDFDDREGQLRRYGEGEDKEVPEGDAAEEAKIVEESKEDNSEDGGLRRDPIDWEQKYKELERKYIDRFFSKPETVEDTEDRYEEESKEVKIEDLFKED